MLPSSMKSSPVPKTELVLAIVQSSKWYIFAFPQVDRTSSNHKQYYQGIIHDLWLHLQNSWKTMAKSMSWWWKSRLLQKLSHQIQTESSFFYLYKKMQNTIVINRSKYKKNLHAPWCTWLNPSPKYSAAKEKIWYRHLHRQSF